jgi:hypothetical protein
MAFENDHSETPAGHAAGAAEGLFEAHAKTIVQQLIELAQKGDPTALRLCIERLIAPLRERPLLFELPPLETPADAVAAFAAIIAGLADGSLSAAEGFQLARIVRTCVETLVLVAREERADGREERDVAERTGPPRVIGATPLHAPRAGEAQLRPAA